MDQPTATTPEAAPAPAPDDSQPASAASDAAQPGFRTRGRARRRARFLRKARELAYRDLGGLVFTLHRFGQRNDPLVIAKLSTLGHIDTELRSLEGALGDHRSMTVLREAGITACPRCAALHSGEDHFCPNCGLPVSRRVDLPIAGAPAAAPGAPATVTAGAAGTAGPATAAGPPTAAGAPTTAGPASGAAAASGAAGARTPSPSIPTPMPVQAGAPPATAVYPAATPAGAPASPTRAPATRPAPVSPAPAPAAAPTQAAAPARPPAGPPESPPPSAAPAPAAGAAPAPAAAPASARSSDEEPTEILRPPKKAGA